MRLIENICASGVPVKEASVIIFLAVSGWRDLKTRKIPVLLTAFFGATGAILSAIAGRSPAELLPALSLGGLFVGLSILTRGKVGMGDSLILLALGTVLEPGELLGVLGLGMIFTVIPALFMLIILRKGRNTELPFVPFLLAGYTGGLFLW